MFPQYNLTSHHTPYHPPTSSTPQSLPLRTTPPPPSLKQIEYRSYLSTITLYHYPTTHHPISLPPHIHLASSDTLTFSSGTPKHFVPLGDEIPPGKIEVAYLRNVFQRGGCALGSRIQEKRCIAWHCFSEPVDEYLAVAVDEAGMKMFDKVAELPRADGDVRTLRGTVEGHAEHRDWYEGLKEACMGAMLVIGGRGGKGNSRRKVTVGVEDGGAGIEGGDQDWEEDAVQESEVDLEDESHDIEIDEEDSDNDDSEDDPEEYA